MYTVASAFPAIDLLVFDTEEQTSWRVRDTVSSLLDQSPRSLLHVQSVAFHIREAFREYIDNSKAMDDYQKAIALSKLDRIKVFINYPQSQLKRSHLDRMYEMLDIRPNVSYFDNFLQYLHFSARMLYKDDYREFIYPTSGPAFIKLRHTISLTSFFVNVSALQSSSVRFLSQKPHLDVEWPGYMIYSSIGHALAHEFAHAFDCVGWYYYANGSYNGRDSWQQNFAKHLYSLESCFYTHYKQYYVCEISLTFSLTCLRSPMCCRWIPN